MGKLIGKDNVQEIKLKLKMELDRLRQNYIPGALVAPKGIEFKGMVTVNMKVTADDIRFFVLGLNICETIERIIDGDYDTRLILYLLDAENDLAYFLKSNFKTAQQAPGVELPDYYFLRTTHLMCSMIRDNLEIKVNLPK